MGVTDSIQFTVIPKETGLTKFWVVSAGERISFEYDIQENGTRELKKYEWLRTFHPDAPNLPENKAKTLAEVERRNDPNYKYTPDPVGAGILSQMESKSRLAEYHGKDVAWFVNPTKPSSLYVDLYQNDERFRTFFDKNYSDLTIEQAVGLDDVPLSKQSFKLRLNWYT